MKGLNNGQRKRWTMEKILALLIATTSIAWENPRVTIRPSTKKETIRIAVLDLKNESRRPDPRIGRIIADRLTFELLSLKRYELVERGQLGYILEEEQIPKGEDLSTEQIQRLGRRLNVDILIQGSISEYAEGDIEARDQRVGIFLKLISTIDGSLLGMASYRKESRKDLTMLTEEVTCLLAKGLGRKLKKMEKEFLKEKKLREEAVSSEKPKTVQPPPPPQPEN